MSGKTSRERRLLRAAVFSAILTAAAVLAHALAGGMLPSTRTVAGSAVTVGAAGWWLAARRRHAVTLAVAAVVGQLGLHSVFALSMTGMSRVHALPLVICGRMTGSAPEQMTVLAPTHSWNAGWMTAAHCLAAAVVVLSARHVEDLALRMVSFVRSTWRLAVLRLIPQSPPRLSPTRTHGRAVGSFLRVFLDCVVARRGPPGPLLSY